MVKSLAAVERLDSSAVACFEPPQTIGPKFLVLFRGSRGGATTMKTVVLTIVLLLSGSAMAGERNSGGPFGGMPAPDLGELPSCRSMDPERRRELDALVDATARRAPDRDYLVFPGLS